MTYLVLLPFTTVTDGRDIYIPSLDKFLDVCTVVTLVHKTFFCNGSSALGLPVRSLLECKLTVNSQILSFPFDKEKKKKETIKLIPYLVLIEQNINKMIQESMYSAQNWSRL